MAYTGTTTPKLLLNKPDAGARPWHDEGNANWDQVEARLATSYAGDPNGNVEGLYIGQYCFDTINGIMSVCTTSGDAVNAVWTPLAVIMDLSALSIGDGLIWDGSVFVAGPIQGSTVGDFKASGAASSLGWLPCDGAAVSRTTYAALFGVMGTAYGNGDGSTTFNVPDFRGRSVIGANNASFGQGENTSLSQRNLGNEGGSESEDAGLPAHKHQMFANDAGPVGSPVTPTGQAALEGQDSGGAKDYLIANSGSPATLGETSEEGSGGGSHNNMPPFGVANWFVYHGVLV